MPLGIAPSVKATSSHSLLGSFKVQVLCSTTPLLTRWPGVMMYGNDHRLCQMAFELVTSPCLDSHFDLISLCVEWDRKECAGCLLITHVFARQRKCACLHLRSLVCAQDFYSFKRLEELLPIMKAVTFLKGSQASIASSLGWGEI